MTCKTHTHYPNISHGRGRENIVKIKVRWCHFPICFVRKWTLCSLSSSNTADGGWERVHRGFAIWLTGISSAYMRCRMANNVSANVVSLIKCGSYTVLDRMMNKVWQERFKPSFLQCFHWLTSLGDDREWKKYSIWRWLEWGAWHSLCVNVSIKFSWYT